ncbi:MAG: hypothetical protein JSS14_22270 [Proteobacteria bacterium]|nr:hypothetical protein [Pseudomonadota bacterium]
MQKHERLVMRALRQEGYGVSIDRSTAGHSRLTLIKSGCTRLILLSCSPSVDDVTVVNNILQCARRAFKR